MNLESLIEKTLYRSRWLLAPIYLGLSLAVIALAVMFFKEAWHMLVAVFTGGFNLGAGVHEGSAQSAEAQLVLMVLSLIDMAMVGGLLIMVMMSGYENFVSQLNVAEDEEKLGWLGTMDSSSLKAKIAASIVAISSIHLLKKFMGVDNTFETLSLNAANSELMWYVIIHMTFVVSAFLMGYLDSKTKH